MSLEKEISKESMALHQNMVYIGGIGLAPIVKPDQVSLFENKTIAYYNLKGCSDVVGKWNIKGIYGPSSKYGVYIHNTQPPIIS